jgi:hypothetical integral membrane protein (TIGR02206 family)
MSGFRPYSLLHLVSLAGVALVIWAFAAAGRAWRGTAAERRLAVGVASVILAFRLGTAVWNFQQPHRSFVQALPLQVCDLLAVVSAVALLKPGGWSYALAYYWGLALSLQGLLQPDLEAGPRELAYWLFWLHHALIVGTAIYLVAARGYRPAWREWRLAAWAALAYGAVAFGLNVVFDTNFGYLGRSKPEYPTLMDLLGPWPWRALVMVALALAAMALLAIPWSGRGRASAEGLQRQVSG